MSHGEWPGTLVLLIPLGLFAMWCLFFALMWREDDDDPRNPSCDEVAP